MDGLKTLRLVWGFEMTHDPFSSSRVSIRRLGSVVQPLVGTIIDAWSKVTDGHAITA